MIYKHKHYDKTLLDKQNHIQTAKNDGLNDCD